MKFLVLALCVCAASAATFNPTPFRSGQGFKNFKGTPNAAAAAVAAPAVLAAKTAAAVVTAPVAAAAAATYAAGATAYNAGEATYQTAKNVVSKSSDESQAAIVRSDSEINDNGYNYVYETANGIRAEASGALKQVGEAAVIVSQGGYAYISPDGTPVQITYTADENGYHPQGDSLPVGPEIPEAILRSLAYIASQPKDAAQNY